MESRPSSEKITEIARHLDLRKNVVRVWFCNQRQKRKRIRGENDLEEKSEDGESSVIDSQSNCLYTNQSLDSNLGQSIQSGSASGSGSGSGNSSGSDERPKPVLVKQTNFDILEAPVLVPPKENFQKTQSALDYLITDLPAQPRQIFPDFDETHFPNFFDTSKQFYSNGIDSEDDFVIGDGFLRD